MSIFKQLMPVPMPKPVKQLPAVARVATVKGFTTSPDGTINISREMSAKELQADAARRAS